MSLQPASKPTSRAPHDPDVQALHDPDVQAPHDPDVQALHDPDVQAPHDPDVQALHDPDVQALHDPDVQALHDPDVQALHDPDTLHDGARRVQAEAIRRVRGRPTAPRSDDGGYAGFVTRVIAFAVDGALIWAVAAAVGVTVGLGVSLLHLPSNADAAIAAVLAALALLWPAAYFVFFWSSAGQTPGARVMSIAVLDPNGGAALKPRRALLRFVGLCLAAIPLGAGILIMLFDSRRRCLQDRLARTVVVYVAGGRQPL